MPVQVMTHFDPLPAFPADGHGLHAAIDAWVRSPPMAALVSGFGGVLPHTVSLLDLLITLEDFSARWDNRRGAERNFARSVPLGRVKEELVLEVAVALGLCGVPAPTDRYFDQVVILGGLAQACITRCEGAAEFVRKEQVPAPSGHGARSPKAPWGFREG
jgi:hypothetical protein